MRDEIEILVNLIITNEQKKDKIMRTIAQRYQEEGLEIGLQKGIQKVCSKYAF